jgi:hypothetical protein
VPERHGGKPGENVAPVTVVGTAGVTAYCKAIFDIDGYFYHRKKVEK